MIIMDTGIINLGMILHYKNNNIEDTTILMAKNRGKIKEFIIKTDRLKRDTRIRININIEISLILMKIYLLEIINLK